MHGTPIEKHEHVRVVLFVVRLQSACPLLGCRRLQSTALSISGVNLVVSIRVFFNHRHLPAPVVIFALPSELLPASSPYWVAGNVDVVSILGCQRHSRRPHCRRLQWLTAPSEYPWLPASLLASLLSSPPSLVVGVHSIFGCPCVALDPFLLTVCCC
jgi:hypothetical protein